MSKITRLFFNYMLLVLAFILSAKNVSAQNVKVDARLQDYTIKLGDQTKLFLVVTQPAKEHVDFPKLGDTITKTVQIVGPGKLDTLVDPKNKGQITVTQSYVITSFDAGVHTMPAFEFIYAGSTLKSSELSIQVQSVKVDTTKAIYDIKRPIVVTYGFLDWLHDHWIWIVIALLVIGAIVGLGYYLGNRKAKEPIVEVPKPVIPAHTIAIEKLKALQAQKLWQSGEVKLYHIELTDILREYLEKRYGIKTHEKTTDEILTSLKSTELNGDNRSVLQAILVTADLVKFAKEKPTPHENDEALEKSLDFVLKTQLIAVSTKDTEGGNGAAV